MGLQRAPDETIIRASSQFDLGARQTSYELQRRISERHRAGSCFDNAAAESFFSTLEHQVLSRYHFTTREEAKTVNLIQKAPLNDIRANSSNCLIDV